MEFGVLGEVQAWAEGQVVETGPVRQRCVLVGLLAEPGRMVSVDELINRVWGVRAPLRVRGTLRTYVSRLRRVLGSDGVRIAWRGGGYVLEIDAEAVDWHRFRELVARARAAHDDEVALRSFAAALALWRGSTAFSGLDSTWVNAARTRLHGERAAAELDYAEVRLRCGQHGELVTELQDRAAAWPLDERVAGQLMVALYRDGRPAEALGHYAAIRARLAEHLGTDPGPELRGLQARMLTGEKSLLAAGRVRPRQLPPDTAGFVGRTRHLAELDRRASALGQRPATVMISAISGMGGIGKTALAVHWAHRSANRFPDGQLYVNLRGYDPGLPLPATEVLALFLGSLGLSAPDIPRAHLERVAHYRTLLADRHMLILLDNAHSADQVRDLLPGTGPSMVLITSRNRLTGLSVQPGAHHIELVLLSEQEAILLLRTHIGDRVDSEPVAATAFSQQCAGLPLALRIAAQHAAARPTSSVADLVTELATHRSLLDMLDGGDTHSNARSVFSWSYRHLDGTSARLFRFLGLHPGRDIDSRAAAALAGIDERTVRQSLATLHRAHLIDHNPHDRYIMHDLLRLYAAELAATEPAHEQQAGLTRLCDHYLFLTHHASSRYAPYQNQAPPPPPKPGTPDLPFHDHQTALAWLNLERANLLATALFAAEHNQSAYTNALSTLLYRYLDIGAHYTDAEQLHTATIQTAHTDGTTPAPTNVGIVHWRAGRFHDAANHYRDALRHLNASAQPREAASLHGNLAIALVRLGHRRKALRHFRSALTLWATIDEPFGEGISHDNLGHLYQIMGRYHDALHEHRHALALQHRSGSQSEIACSHSNLGLEHSHLGHHRQALHHHRQALAILNQNPDRQHLAEALNRYGITLRLLGKPRQSLTHHRQALTIVTDIGDRYEQAITHTEIAQCHHVLNELTAATIHRHHARTLYHELNIPHRATSPP